MGADPITAGLGAVSLFSGMEQNRKNDKRIGKQQKIEQKIQQRALDFFDSIVASDKGGQFNPEGAIEKLDKEQNVRNATDLGNIGGAYGSAGYRPGDSVVGDTLSRAVSDQIKSRESMHLNLRRTMFQDKLGAYSTALSGLGLPAQIAQNQIGQANQGMQDPSQMFMALMPFLNLPKKQQAPGGNTPGFNLGGTFGNNVFQHDPYGNNTGG